MSLVGSQGLSASRIVNVTVTLTPPLAQFPSFNTCLVLGTSAVIDTVTRMRDYVSLDEVAEDFSNEDEEYLSALSWFGQAPQPNNLLIGRWCKTAAAGQLLGGPVTPTNQLIATWTAIETGSMTIHIDALAAKNLTALNFSEAANLNAVAAIITTALDGEGTCVWDANFERFEITSATTGAASAVSFATPEGTGVDISGIAGLTAATSGAYVAPGLAPETALSCVQLFDQKFSSQWYGLFIPSAVDADFEVIGPYCDAANPAHFLAVNTQEGGVIVPGDTGDIAYILQELEVEHCLVQYSSTGLYAAMSALARILTTNWAGSNTAITLMYKTEPGIIPELLNETQADALEAKNCNVYVDYNNGTAILEPGITPSGQFVDTVIGCDWLRAEIQTNVFNLLFGTSTKIPQTDAGNHLLGTAIAAACQTGVGNGLIAPGQWNAGGFGQLSEGDYLPTGYYIYIPPINSQSENDREARKSVPIQVAVKLAGAIHTVDVAISVNP